MSLFMLLACFEANKVEPEPLPTPVTPAAQVNWLAYETALSELLVADPNMNTDERDRLTAALALVDAMESGKAPDQAVTRYLDALLRIEARGVPEEMEEIPVLIPPVTEETIDTDFDTAIGPDDARALLAEERYVEALRGLEPVRDQHPELWMEAVDGYVHAERERAGALYLKALKMPQGEIRDSAFEEVIGTLEGLLLDYPESSYASDIEENLETVRANASPG